MARPTNITLCSFCGKSHAEVKKLIQGRAFTSATTASSSAKASWTRNLLPLSRKSQRSINSVPKPVEIKNYLDKYCIGQDQAKKTLGGGGAQSLQARPA